MDNKGGVVESCRLVSNVLPLGLRVAVSNGECVIEGTSLSLTLEESVSPISIVGADAQTVSYTNLVVVSMPVLIMASNGDGLSQVPVNVTVAPRYASGDLSVGVIPTNADVLRDRGANNSNFIYKADNLPFASGGTGAYNDPVLVFVDEKADALSFVVDFGGVNIPVTNFDSLASEQKEFHIRFLNVNFRNTNLFPEGQAPIIVFSVMNSQVIMDEVTFYGITASFASPVTYFTGDSIPSYISLLFDAIKDDLVDTLRVVFREGGNRISNGSGIFRFSLLNLDSLRTDD